MRDYKFRGKRIDDGEWVFGYYVQHPDALGKVVDYIIGDGFRFPVDPETVGQYTGLKDKNGKEVYEGDITWDEEYEEYCIVEFKEGCFWYTGQTSTQELYERCDQLEIDGNIYDNPELLQGGTS